MITPGDDYEVFLSDFAKDVVINGALTVTGILDAPGLQTAFVESTDPTFECKTTDLATVSRGMTLVDGGTTYKIVVIPPDDGLGFTKIILERQ